MYSVIHNSHKKPLIRPHYSGDVLGRLGENRKQLENQEKEEAKKWGQELLGKVFTKTTTKKSAEDILKTEIQKLDAQGKNIKKGTPYGTIIEEYKLFMKDIFDEKGNYKQNAADGITELSKAIGIDGVTDKEDLEKMKKGVSEFIKKYPLDTFVDKVHYATVKHPFISKTWVFFNDYGDIKKKVKELDGFLPSEYKSVIQTAENIMLSKEFQKNTGNVETAIRERFGQGKSVEEFQKNMKTILDMSKSQKRVFTMDTFSRQFDENRKLTSAEEKNIDTYILRISGEIDKITEKSQKINRLKAIIEANKRNPNNLTKAELKLIDDRLISAQLKASQGSDNGWFDFANDVRKKIIGSGNTEENRNMAQLIADEKTKGGTLHFISFNKEKNNYVVVSMDELRDSITYNINNLNVAVFKSFLALPDWKDFLMKKFGGKAIAAVGAYIRNNPNTRLFEGENTQAKEFFIAEYRKTIVYQEDLLNKAQDKLRGDFKDLFPSLASNPKITTEIQELIKGKKVTEAYNKLAEGGATNGDIRIIMEGLEKDATLIKERGLKENDKWAKFFGTKKVQDIKDQFVLGDPRSRERFKQLETKIFMGGQLGKDEKLFLLRVSKPGSDARQALESSTNTESAANIQAQSNTVKRTTNSLPANIKAKKLDETVMKRTEAAGIALEAHTLGQLNMNQAMVNIEGIDQFKTDSEKLKKLAELEKRDIKTLTEKERNMLLSLQNWYKNYTEQARAISAYAKISSTEEATTLVQETYGMNLSKTEARRYVDSQEFISKYVAEKNFVDIVEKNAAYMNLGQSKSISELYGEGKKMDISNMSSDDGSVRLSETNILGNNSFQGMNELMNCKVEIGTSGLFTRTIRSPEGDIVAENIPLENIKGTIQQLGRFYTLGLGSLAPYMEQVSITLSKSRSDKITGLDGGFDINEDKKFLKIMAILIYGKDSLPADPNIPNLIALFNRPGQERNPKYLLRKNGIIQDTGAVNTIRLDAGLLSASKEVI